MNKLNFFYPMLTISLIPFLCHNKKKIYLMIFFLGLIYDLLYSNIFLYHVILFLILFTIDEVIIKYFNRSLLLFILLAILNILIYDSITFLLVLLSSYANVTIYDLIYKIKNSILLNILSVFVYYFLFKKRGANT